MLAVHWLTELSIMSRLRSRNPGKRRSRRSCTLLPQQFERLEQRIAASECLSSFAVSSLASHAIAKRLELPDNPSSAHSSQVEAETDTTQESMDAAFSIGLASQRNQSGTTPPAVSPSTSTTKSPQPAIASLESRLSSGLGAGLPEISPEISPPSQPSFSQPTRQIVATQPALNPVAASPGLAASSSAGANFAIPGIPSPSEGGASSAQDLSNGNQDAFMGNISAAPMSAATNSSLSISPLALATDTNIPGDQKTSDPTLIGTITVDPGISYTGINVTINGFMSSFQQVGLGYSNSISFIPSGIMYGHNTVTVQPVGQIMPDQNNPMMQTVYGNIESFVFDYNILSIANTGSFSVVHDSSMPQVLTIQNDDFNTLTPTVVSQPSHGQVTFGSYYSITPNVQNRYFTYTPTPGSTGTDTFTYKVNDGFEDSNTAQVTVNVLNNAPTVQNPGAYNILHDHTLTMGGGVLLQGAGATDADGDPMTAYSTAQPSHGSVQVSADGSFVYTPDAHWYGADQFTYKVTDGISDSTPITVPINVTDQEPNLVEQSTGTLENVGLNVNLLAGDVDPDGDNLVVSNVVASSGSISVSNIGVGVFTPAVDSTNYVTITYDVGDGARSKPAHMNVNVVALVIHLQIADESDESAEDEQEFDDNGNGNAPNPVDHPSTTPTLWKLSTEIPAIVDRARVVPNGLPLSLKATLGQTLIDGASTSGSIWNDMLTFQQSQSEWLIPIKPSGNGHGAFDLRAESKLNGLSVGYDDFIGSVGGLDALNTANGYITPALVSGVNQVTNSALGPINAQLDALINDPNTTSVQVTMLSAAKTYLTSLAGVASAQLAQSVTDGIGGPAAKFDAFVEGPLGQFDAMLNQHFVFQANTFGFNNTVGVQISPISTQSMVTQLSAALVQQGTNPTGSALNDTVKSLFEQSIGNVGISARTVIGDTAITAQFSTSLPSTSNLINGQLARPFDLGVGVERNGLLLNLGAHMIGTEHQGVGVNAGTTFENIIRTYKEKRY